ncbi:MAG: hypothetical protein IKL55_02110 [Clostridia bacterium]|nr:hypothetical protein [Clostridia bacterium]
MPSRQYAYQYETSPRKIKPDYSKPKRNAPQYNKTKTKIKPKTKSKAKPKTKIKQSTKEELKSTSKKQDELKSQNILIAKTKVAVFFKSALLFLIVFFMIFMNTRLSESIAQIQDLKAKITDMQKENDQLEINIQNNINLNNIEQAAKELLGMQKLSSRQTFYISLPKKDYVEPRTEKVIIEEEEPSVIEKIVEKIKNIF